ncbi:MAG: hypothetical protein RIK85_15595 [Marinobacter sp.]
MTLNILKALPRIVLVLSVLAPIALTAGCSQGGSGEGGGRVGGDSDSAPTTTPSAPTISLTPQTAKIFNFTWGDVSTETEYRLLENPDGTSGYTPVATLAADSTNHDYPVFLPGRINASYILQACNEVGCADSDAEFVSGTLAAAVGYAKGSNTETGDEFGTALAVSADGNTLAVGVSHEDSNATGVGGDQTDNSAGGSGAVYIFTRSDGTWSQQAYIKASNTDPLDGFGQALALSADGNTLAVGAGDENSSANGVDGNQSDNSAEDSGAVYVFTRSDGAWSQQAYIKASNTESGDLFGTALALSADGNTLAVGAVREGSNATGVGGNQNDNSAGNSGAIYVFTRSAGIWSQEAYVKASNTQTGDEFGTALALSEDGNTLAVGASLEDSNATGVAGNQNDNSAGDSGAVYVFTRSDDTWSQRAYVKASNTDPLDGFGQALALSEDGGTLAVGAVRESSNSTGVEGNQSDNSAGDSGAVYVFIHSDGIWSQQAYVKPSNTESGDMFGEALALSADGNTLAVSAVREDNNATGVGGYPHDNSAGDSGAMYVFTRSAGTWSQLAYVKASNTEAGDEFGAALALSADGNTLAVGATLEDSNATGVDGNQSDNSAANSGAVYLF